jgi:hypothetical protein
MNSEGLIEGNMYAVYYLKTALFGSALGDAMEINSNICIRGERVDNQIWAVYPRAERRVTG